MTNLHFKETCPCGNSVDVSGYGSQVQPHVQSWHHIHDKHANAIAKAVAENKLKPPYYVWPNSVWSNTPTITLETALFGGAVKAEE